MRPSTEINQSVYETQTGEVANIHVGVGQTGKETKKKGVWNEDDNFVDPGRKTWTVKKVNNKVIQRQEHIQ